MKLERYNIVTVRGISFEDVKLSIREKVMEMCHKGWKLQGGASVTVKKYDKMVFYDVYQTMIPGKQKLIDYNIIRLSTSCETFPEAVSQMEILLKDQCEQCKWKLQGGASVNSEIIFGKSEGPNYEIYQTLVK